MELLPYFASKKVSNKITNFVKNYRDSRFFCYYAFQNSKTNRTVQSSYTEHLF